LARLPAEGLAAYRRRVDPLAEGWYREGLANRDERLLQRLVDEMLCSSWGDDALLALGELALERGDYHAARRAWEQISPLLRAPDGSPPWIALRDVNVEANWPEVERRWHARQTPPSWLAYPDTQLDLAEVRARLILASARAGQLDRAALEFAMFRRLHSAATGRFGGQSGPLVPALERLLSAAREWSDQQQTAGWPTFAGSAARSPHVAALDPVSVPAWPSAAELVRDEVFRFDPRNMPAAFGGGVDDQSQVETDGMEDVPTCFPVAVGSVIMVADAEGIHALDLKTAEKRITPDGVLYRSQTEDQPQRELLPFAAGVFSYGAPHRSLTISQSRLFARVGTLATARVAGNRSSANDRIIGLDLQREGLLSFSATPDDASWAFDGVPVSNGQRLFVAMRHSDIQPHAFVACYDLSSGARLWRTSIAAGDTPAGPSAEGISHNLLTLDEDRIYFNTNLGVVAALDAHTGRICGLRRYDRLAGKRFSPHEAPPAHFDRDPSPCLYHAGLVIVAPADSPAIFALDAQTGQLIWENDRIADGLHLLGVAGNTLAVGGTRLRGIDVRSGRTAWIWPESEQAGIRGMGRGLVAHNEIFWPTRTEIYALSASTGARTRTPISLEMLGNSGANLAVAGGRLIAAGPTKLMVFGPAPAAPVEEKNNSKEETVALRQRPKSNQ
jgi:outer membrane protein assembly factor BamB